MCSALANAERLLRTSPSHLVTNLAALMERTRSAVRRMVIALALLYETFLACSRAAMMLYAGCCRLVGTGLALKGC